MVPMSAMSEERGRGEGRGAREVLLNESGN